MSIGDNKIIIIILIVIILAIIILATYLIFFRKKKITPSPSPNSVTITPSITPSNETSEDQSNDLFYVGDSMEDSQQRDPVQEESGQDTTNLDPSNSGTNNSVPSNSGSVPSNSGTNNSGTNNSGSNNSSSGSNNSSSGSNNSSSGSNNSGSNKSAPSNSGSNKSVPSNSGSNNSSSGSTNICSLCLSDSYMSFNNTYSDLYNMLSSRDTYGSINNVKYVTGITATTKALEFNNTDKNSISLGFKYNFTKYNILSNGITVSIWMNLYDLQKGAELPILTFADSTSAKYMWGIGIKQYRLKFYVGDISNPDDKYWIFNATTFDYSLLKFTWYHLVATIDKNRILRMYINGVYITQVYITGTMRSYDTVFIVKSMWRNVNQAFYGALQNFRVYKRVLSNTDIKSIYDNKY